MPTTRSMRYVTWPNALTALRIALIAPITLAVARRSIAWILALYALAALTDVFDGLIARRTGTASHFGAMLDGFADILFGIGIFAWSATLFPQDRAALLAMLALSLAFLLAGGVVSLARFGRILSPHLQSARVAAVVVAAMFPLAVLSGYPLTLMGIGTAAFLAARVHAIAYFARLGKEEAIAIVSERKGKKIRTA